MATERAARTKASGSGAVEDRPTQLIEIASRLFATHGFAGTSLRDIAEEAKVTKAALDYHFPNKEALYERIVVDNLQSLIDRVSDARVLAACPEAPLKIVTDQLRSYPAAKAEIPELATMRHVFVKACARVNNRAENSHQPTRERERRVRVFRRPERTRHYRRPS